MKTIKVKTSDVFCKSGNMKSRDKKKMSKSKRKLKRREGR